VVNEGQSTEAAFDEQDDVLLNRRAILLALGPCPFGVSALHLPETKLAAQINRVTTEGIRRDHEATFARLYGFEL